MLELRRFAQVVFGVMSGMLILPHVARPHVLNGSVVGNVKDPSGGAVPGTSVTLTSNTTNLSRELVTDAQGGYDSATVRPGVYSVKVDGRDCIVAGSHGAYVAFTLPAEGSKK